MAQQDRTRMKGAAEGDWIYERTAEFIRDNLFREAGGHYRAFERIRDFVNASEGVDVSVQLYVPLTGSDEYGLMFLPLRVMSAPGSRIFSNDFSQFSPLPDSGTTGKECISNWQVIVNPDLANVGSSPDNKKAALADSIQRLEDLPETRWRATTLSGYDDIRDYFAQFPDARRENAMPAGATGLIVVAHYGHGTLGLEGGEVLPIDGFDRRFPAGSAAFLAACETAIPTEADGIIRQLRRDNVETFVASPLQVPVDYAVALMDNLVMQIDDAYAHGRTPTLGELYRNAMAAVERQSDDDNISNKVLGREYVLAGNPDQSLCKLGPTREQE
jgi:hypothetical protein